jgi:hypothetical protein
MKKAGIPGVGTLPPDLVRILEPIKQNLEIITGARPGVLPIAPLPSDAQLPAVIAKVNEIVSRISQNG